MVPAAFPIFPALALLSYNCPRKVPAGVLRQRQTELDRGFIDWLELLMYEVNLHGQRFPRRRVGVAGLGLGRSRYDGWRV